jgi:hypothetical protein
VSLRDAKAASSRRPWRFSVLGCSRAVGCSGGIVDDELGFRGGMLEVLLWWWSLCEANKHWRRCRTSAVCAMTSWWAMLPHNSSSLLLTVPLGLRKDTKSSWTCRGKADLHRCGVVVSPVTSGTKKTPPVPVPAASQAPTTLGAEGTSSAMRVGRLERSFASHRKSWRTPWTARVRRSRGRARSWRRENKPRAPGNAMDMERRFWWEWYVALLGWNQGFYKVRPVLDALGGRLELKGGVEKRTLDFFPSGCIALCCAKEIIDVNVPMFERPRGIMLLSARWEREAGHRGRLWCL